jgi:phosphatidate cytidylyltransferase
MWLGGWPWRLVVGALAVLVAVEWWRMWRHRPTAGALAAGIAYVAVPTIALIWLRDDVLVGRANLIFTVLIVWASDVGAYVFGRLIGGPKLAPAISPGKTWSGALGGLLCAGLIGLAAVAMSSGSFAAGALARAMLVAGALGVVSELGDLFESGIKRHFGVKDSGGLIPGHGGLMDRLDGLIAAGPAACVLALALGRGVELWR